MDRLREWGPLAHAHFPSLTDIFDKEVVLTEPNALYKAVAEPYKCHTVLLTRNGSILAGTQDYGGCLA